MLRKNLPQSPLRHRGMSGSFGRYAVRIHEIHCFGDQCKRASCRLDYTFVRTPTSHIRLSLRYRRLGLFSLDCNGC